ncbi:MAG: hypothetical protein ACYSWW_03960, partial [Planctomycetota bacterium]|jgi:hypothetical protein
MTSDKKAPNAEVIATGSSGDKPVFTRIEQTPKMSEQKLHKNSPSRSGSVKKIAIVGLPNTG